MNAYGALCTEFYDHDKPQAPADAIAYYRARAFAASGPVLEPMSGSGRFLLPLLKAGIDIDGVDAAPAMLAACRRRAAREGLEPQLYHQPIESLDLPRRYALAFIPSGSIGLCAPPVLPEVLSALRRHLQPGAALLLELATWADQSDTDPAGTATVLPPRRVMTDATSHIDYLCQSILSADRQSHRFEGRYEQWRDGECVLIETESLTLWRYPPQALLEMLRAAGFDSARVLESDAYPGLAESGCVLIAADVAS